MKTIQNQFKIDFFLHKDDVFLINNLNEQTTTFGLNHIPKPNINKFINDGDKISLGHKVIKVIHTPGHTPGCVCYYVENVIFVGDTMFAGSIGRTDFPGSSYETLIKSIKEKLFPLGDSIIVYPGHGPSTTIGKEKRHNPFLT